MKVLLVVDVQNDFCPGGPLAVPCGDEVVAPINRLMRSGNYDLVVATKDWHPADHKSFAANHAGKNVFDVVELSGQPQVLWPVHCVQGTPGAELHDGLDRELIDRVVEKGTNPEIDSYSGFFDNQKLSSTRLLEVIAEEAEARGASRGEVELHVAGLAIDYCVKASAIDAAELGFKTSLILDAARAVNLAPGDDVAAQRAMIAAGVEVIESRDVLVEPERSITERPRGADLQP